MTHFSFPSQNPPAPQLGQSCSSVSLSAFLSRSEECSFSSSSSCSKSVFLALWFPLHFRLPYPFPQVSLTAMWLLVCHVCDLCDNVTGLSLFPPFPCSREQSGFTDLLSPSSVSFQFLRKLSLSGCLSSLLNFLINENKNSPKGIRFPGFKGFL